MRAACLPLHPPPPPHLHPSLAPSSPPHKACVTEQVIKGLNAMSQHFSLHLISSECSADTPPPPPHPDTHTHIHTHTHTGLLLHPHSHSNPSCLLTPPLLSPSSLALSAVDLTLSCPHPLCEVLAKPLLSHVFL